MDASYYIDQPVRLITILESPVLLAVFEAIACDIFQPVKHICGD